MEGVWSLNNAVRIGTVLALKLSRFIFEALSLSRGGFVFAGHRSEVTLRVHSAHLWSTVPPSLRSEQFLVFPLFP